MGGIRTRSTILAATAMLLLPGANALAAPAFLGMGSIPLDAWVSHPAVTLENGLDDNLIGIGSGIAYAGTGNRFLVLPDRGPNATPYDTAFKDGATVDKTVSYRTRFYELDLGIDWTGSGWNIVPRLVTETFFTDDGGRNFVGLSEDFLRRHDPEGIRVGGTGTSVYISDEYGPTLIEFDRKTGREIRRFKVPAKFLAARPRATEKAEIAANVIGRVSNKGFEGLAITPDGGTLVAILQNPLRQDGALDEKGKKLGQNVRILALDIATGATREYAYVLHDSSYGISEILAVNDHEFLVDERDGDVGGVKRLYRIDLRDATDISGVCFLPESGEELAEPGIRPVTDKGVFLDLTPALAKANIRVPEKIEGLAFGPDVMRDGKRLHTLVILNDNDFLPGTGNNFYVFGFTDDDLPDFRPQAFR